MLDRPDLHDVARIVELEMIAADPGRALHPQFLVALHVDGAVDAFEQGGDALDVVGPHRPADVVGVVVSRQHAGHPHAIGGDRVEQIGHRVRRVDQQAFARGPITHGVDEVDHLLGQRVVYREVATREQLAEVEPIVGVVRCHPSYASDR